MHRFVVSSNESVRAKKVSTISVLVHRTILKWFYYNGIILYDTFISLELLCIYRILFTLQSGYHTFRETLGIWEEGHFQESIDPVAWKDRIVWSAKYVEVGTMCFLENWSSIYI